MAGGNAIIVAVIIPVAAAVRLTPPTVAALMMTAGSVGLFTGPFHPQHRDDPGLGGLSYPDLLYAGSPMSAVTLLAGWVMAGRIQKMTEGKLRYDDSRSAAGPVAQQRRRKLSALAFAATIIVMAIVGVVIKAGFSFAIIVMLPPKTSNQKPGPARFLIPAIPSNQVRDASRIKSGLIYLFTLDIS